MVLKKFGDRFSRFIVNAQDDDIHQPAILRPSFSPWPYECIRMELHTEYWEALIEKK